MVTAIYLSATSNVIIIILFTYYFHDFLCNYLCDTAKLLLMYHLNFLLPFCSKKNKYITILKKTKHFPMIVVNFHTSVLVQNCS